VQSVLLLGIADLTAYGLVMALVGCYNFIFLLQQRRDVFNIDVHIAVFLLCLLHPILGVIVFHAFNVQWYFLSIPLDSGTNFFCADHQI
jgi:FtsH-binding integral membrane protein